MHTKMHMLASRNSLKGVPIPYVERFTHHVGGSLLKNSVVATIEKHVNIHTDCMCVMYVKIRIHAHMYETMWENAYKVRIPNYT
jgi:hypothetical protein